MSCTDVNTHTHAHYKVAEIYELHTWNIKPMTFSGARGSTAPRTCFSKELRGIPTSPAWFISDSRTRTEYSNPPSTEYDESYLRFCLRADVVAQHVNHLSWLFLPHSRCFKILIFLLWHSALALLYVHFFPYLPLCMCSFSLEYSCLFMFSN